MVDRITHACSSGFDTVIRDEPRRCINCSARYGLAENPPTMYIACIGNSLNHSHTTDLFDMLTETFTDDSRRRVFTQATVAATEGSKKRATSSLEYH